MSQPSGQSINVIEMMNKLIQYVTEFYIAYSNLKTQNHCDLINRFTKCILTSLGCSGENQATEGDGHGR